MADVIDFALVSVARRILRKLLTRRGIAYFMARDGQRLMALDPTKVELVVRSAVRARQRELSLPTRQAVELCRKGVRRELIRRVALGLLNAGY